MTVTDGMGKWDTPNGISARKAGRHRTVKEDGQGVGGHLQHTATPSVAEEKNAR